MLQHEQTPFERRRRDDPENRQFLSELLRYSLDRKCPGAMTTVLSSFLEEGRLDLSELSINVLPEEMGFALEELEVAEVNLANNKLNTVPSSLQKYEVRVDGNPLDGIPEPFRKSWGKIQEYLRSVQNRSTQWTECKLLFVGQEGVGKT